jgi:hypothetical protein
MVRLSSESRGVESERRGSRRSQLGALLRLDPPFNRTIDLAPNVAKRRGGSTSRDLSDIVPDGIVPSCQGLTR